MISVSTFLAIARRTRIGHSLAVLVLIASISAAGAEAAFRGANGRIYFTATAAGATTTDVWSIEPGGGGLTNLTDAPGGPREGRDPSVAPNGTVAFTVGDGPAAEIWAMRADGSAPAPLTANAVADEFPAVAPDGSRIAFARDSGGASGRDLWTIGADGSGAAPLLTGPGDDLDPQYLNSGDYVFGASAIGPAGDFDIAYVPVAGAPHAAATSITFRSAADERQPALPPDRVRLAYAQSSGGQADIHTAYTTDGTDEFALAVDPLVDERAPAFSPDGTKVVYATPSGLVIASAGGNGPRPLATPGAAGATDPDWAVGASRDAVAPQTTITKDPRRRSSKRSPRLRFRANEPASFECSLDRRHFSPCESPLRLRRLSVHRHRFAVRAIDAAGNVDPSPAKARFRIIPPR